MIAVIDYGMGNRHSVQNALQYLGEDSVVCSDEASIVRSERIILPGVGAFGAAMDSLRQSGLLELLTREVIEKGKPFMGICLGMQLLAEEGTEKGLNKGLGWIPGRVDRLQPDDPGLKLPHIGWNDIQILNEHALLKGLKKEKAFYFVHSYAFQLASPEHLLATSSYGGPFTAAVLKDNIFATQFHPEKSQKNGLLILENFCSWRP